MLSNTQLTVVRTVATAVVTALATLQVLYPSYTWIAAATAAFATLGIHAIPSIQQSKGNTMTDGLTAMGLKPAEQTQTAEVTPATVEVTPATVETPAVTPASTVQEAPLPDSTPLPVTATARQALADAANALLKIAESL